MLQFHLNLATNPFVNLRKYYLIGGLLLIVGVVGAIFSVGQYIHLRGENRNTSQNLQRERQTLKQLEDEEIRLKEDLKQPHVLDEIDQITFYNRLIDRKTFPWTQFFEDLESVIPYNVQITEIHQRAGVGASDVEMVFMGRSAANAIAFLKNLETSPKFQQVVVNEEGQFRDAATHQVSGDVAVTVHMQYKP